MRFISKWSYAGARGLAEALKEDHKKRLEYYFALQLIIGESFKTIILFGIALVLDIFVPTLLIAATFVMLRLLAGGYHMDSQGKCMYATLGILIPPALLAKYTYPYWSFVGTVILIALTFLTAVYILGKYAPRDTANKPIDDAKKRRKLKMLSFSYLLIWLILSVLLNIFDFRLAAICLSFGVLVELFIISPTGHSFFDFFKNGAKIKRKAA